MRAAALAVFLLVPDAASACPQTVSTDDAPATGSPCMAKVDFSTAHRQFEVHYAVGGGGTMQTGVGEAASAFAGLQLGYGLQFGRDPAQPSYEAEVNLGATVQQIGGAVTATSLATQGALRLGPARMHPSVVDEGRGNLAVFPLTMEIAHAGELNARPRLAARPELARGLYHRERVEVATRLIRVEGAGEKAQTGAPGQTVANKPSAWALDAITLHGGVDAAMQDGTRFETTIGGSMLGVADHTNNMSIDVFGIEHRRIDAPMIETNIDTLWVLRLDLVSPMTGTRYYMGWGEVIDMPRRDELAGKVDPEEGTLSIGGIGWFTERAWGGFGLQYKREPFVSVTGEVGLEDRISGEVAVPKLFGLVARAFAARTTQLVDDELRHDGTAGIALDATYVRDGFSSKLGIEVGRTFYTALDDAMPTSTGFAASLGLTIQHAGGRTWTR